MGHFRCRCFFLLGGLLLEYADNLAPAMVLGVSHPAKSSRVTLSSTRLSAASSSYAADGDFHETLIVAACWRQVCRCILISNFRNLLKNKPLKQKLPARRSDVERDDPGRDLDHDGFWKRDYGLVSRFRISSFKQLFITTPPLRHSQSENMETLPVRLSVPKPPTSPTRIIPLRPRP